MTNKEFIAVCTETAHWGDRTLAMAMLKLDKCYSYVLTKYGRDKYSEDIMTAFMVGRDALKDLMTLREAMIKEAIDGHHNSAD